MSPYLFAWIVGASFVRECDGLVLGVHWGNVFVDAGNRVVALARRTSWDAEWMLYHGGPEDSVLAVRNIGGRERERAVHTVGALLERQLRPKKVRVACLCGSAWCGRPLCEHHDECRANMEMAALCPLAGRTVPARIDREDMDWKPPGW